MDEKIATMSVNGLSCSIPQPATLAEAVRRYSPFGEEPVLVTLNDVTYRSIDNLDAIAVAPGCEIELFPLIIGG